MPDLIKTYRANQDKIVMLGINLNDTPEEVKAHVSEFKIPFIIAIDNTGDLIYKFRAMARPFTVFINKQGVITGIVAGKISLQTLEQELTKALA